jgi:glycerol-3-phosphate dehydrogenase
MAEDTIDQAADLAGLPAAACTTADMPIHGHHQNVAVFGDLATYGSDAPGIERLMQETLRLREPLHPRLHLRAGEVVWAVRHEMARTVEDVLARRTRSLLLDARASTDIAPRVAELMALELGRDEGWQRDQVDTYRRLAEDYIVA